MIRILVLLAGGVMAESEDISWINTDSYLGRMGIVCVDPKAAERIVQYLRENLPNNLRDRAKALRTIQRKLSRRRVQTVEGSRQGFVRCITVKENWHEDGHPIVAMVKWDNQIEPELTDPALLVAISDRQPLDNPHPRVTTDRLPA